jgi:hypothetical protein
MEKSNISQQIPNANLSLNSISKNDYTSEENVHLFSVYYIGKCYFDRQNIKFNLLESLILFRICAQSSFQDSFILYCNAIDFCLEFSSVQNQFIPYLEHFLSNRDQSIPLNEKVALYFHELSIKSNLNAICISGIFFCFGFGTIQKLEQAKINIWFSAYLKHFPSLLFFNY